MFATNSYAIDHSGHGGGNSGGGGGGSLTCEKIRFDKFQPEHLSTVAPESEFTFTAFNVQKPEQIEVTVKSQLVEIKTEARGNLYRVTGKLPSELKIRPLEFKSRRQPKLKNVTVKVVGL